MLISSGYKFLKVAFLECSPLGHCSKHGSANSTVKTVHAAVCTLSDQIKSCSGLVSRVNQLTFTFCCCSTTVLQTRVFLAVPKQETEASVAYPEFMKLNTLWQVAWTILPSALTGFLQPKDRLLAIPRISNS